MVSSEYNTPDRISLEVIRVFLAVIHLVFTTIAIASIPKTFCRRDPFPEFLFQMLFIFPILILTFTVAAEFVYSLVSPMLVTALFVSALYFLRKWNTDGTFEKLQIYIDDQPRGITFFRSAINIITSCVILACDFKIFPSSFYKSKAYGVGLMDTGIGLFVFSMGIVSKPVKNRKALKSLITQASVLLALGVVRTVAIRIINYHQDEREYGRDLNAFITLGLTKLIGGLLSSISIPVLFSGLVIGFIHEVVLQSGVGNYCINETILRITFFEANREGLISITGFISLYLLSVFIGSIMLKSQHFEFVRFKIMMTKLSVISAISWSLTFGFVYTTGISRRIANFGYITWIVSLATTTLIISSLVFDVILKVIHKNDKCLPVIFDIVNFNGLVYFLVSNVLTGLVNMFLDPDKRSTAESICILIIYMIIPCIVNRILYSKRVRIS
ncbi:PIGW.2 family protein [Megaselia abdita]